MYVVGTHYGHDASVALVGHGRIIHYEKERFTRVRHDSGDIRSLYHLLLQENGIDPHEIVAAVCTSLGDNFNAVRSRQSWNSLAEVDESRTSYFGPNIPCYWIPHHTAHLAYALYTSKYTEAEVLAIDGRGDPYVSFGKPDHAFAKVSHPFNERCSGRWIMDQPPPNHIGGEWDNLSSQLFGSWHAAGTVMAMVGIPYTDFSQLTGFDMSVRDAVLSLQEKTTRTFVESFSGGFPALLSGGCALNGIANYEVLKKCGQVYVPPAAHDGGISVGAALYILHYVLGYSRVQYAPDVVAYAGHDVGAAVENELDQMIDQLEKGHAVPFMVGRAESGPRALGHRSMLADPRRESSRALLNAIKGRQIYRPTAPVMLKADGQTYFDLLDDEAYDYMTVIAPSNSRAKEEIPAALHYDGSARVQLVDDHSPLCDLLKAWKDRTGIPVLLNTSLNLKGMPIANDFSDVAEI